MKKEFNVIGFKKLANILRIVMNIFYWISLGGIIISILAIPVVFFVTKGDLTANHFLNGNGSLTINLDTGRGLSFNLPKIAIPYTADFTRIIMSIIGTSAISCLAMMVIFRQIRDILKTVITGTPFEAKNSKRILNIGAILIGFSITFNVLISAILMNIIDTLSIRDINISSGVDMFMLFAGIFLIILSGVFKYGAFLQNEYDTTL